MNNTEHPLSDQNSKPPDHPHDTAGTMLRKARETANLTQAAVGEALHLTVHYIKALENDDYSKLPGTTFVKGYLRVYARYLQLDVNAVLASYEKNNVSEEELSNRTELLSRSQKRHDQTFRWAVVTAVIIVLGVAAGWWFVGKDQTAAAAVTATLQQSSPQPADGPAAAIASQVTAPSSPLNVFSSKLITTPVVTAIVSGQDDLATNTSIPEAASAPALMNDSSSGNAQTQAASKPSANNQSTSLAFTSVAIAGEHDTSLTVTTNAQDARQITLTSTGSDLLQFNFKGSSRLEIEDYVKGSLYSDTLSGGETITLRGTAPFKIRLGDATQVELSFNSQPIDLNAQIKNDKTAHFSIGTTATPSNNIATSEGAIP